MATSTAKISKSYEILSKYNGKNTYIINLKNGVFAYKNKTLSDFEVDYVLKNHDFEPILLNKLVPIAHWWGEKKQIDWNTEFLPEKIVIGYLIGETDTHYHAYVKYRRSQERQALTFIPKQALLNPLFLENYMEKDVDFSKYNELGGITLKQHQENAIKFLLTRKKAIVSLQQGLGKSMVGIVAALEGGFDKILVICPASIKITWKEEIARFVSEDDISIVEGSKWDESKFTIINYDILRKFYTVPKETKNVKEKVYNDDGTVSWKTVEKTVKTNKKSIVDEALDNSQLFNSHFDLVIIDEAHRLSNNTSGFFQIIEDLLKRSKPESIYELTGTMVKNAPSNLYNILKIIDADITKDWKYYHTMFCGAKQIFRNRKERDYYTNIFLKGKKKNSWYDLTYSEKEELNDYLSKNCKKIWIMGEATNLDELSERIKHLYYREVNDFDKLGIKKETKLIEYRLSDDEQRQYDSAWEDYISNNEEKDIDKLIKNHKLIEGAVFRQLLSEFMIPRTIELAEKEISLGKRIIIFCCFDKEIYALQEYFKERCVVYNGKLTLKKKDETLKKFKSDESIKVFLGNIESSSVGLSLNECSVCIFNTTSFVTSTNNQGEFRVLRIGQDKDVTIYYQKFLNTFHERMFEILEIKSNISNQIINDNNT